MPEVQDCPNHPTAEPAPPTSCIASTVAQVVHPAAARTIAWERDAADRFCQRMLDRQRLFPCIFGTDALRRGSLRFAFVPNDPRADAHLATALREFVDMAPELGNRTSLVAFFEPSPDMDTIEDYRRCFWSLLQSLHAQDPSPWPSEIPLDSEHSEWEFCFADMPMFVVANTPAHRHRASRFFEYFCITFQPRFVFDDIAETSPQGQNARKIIRGRLLAYDTVPLTPSLGSFGAPGNREWTQYFLSDDNEVVPESARCPLQTSITIKEEM
jgi:FPC/CPF motif-containing protein YcgG